MNMLLVFEVSTYLQCRFAFAQLLHIYITLLSRPFRVTFIGYLVILEHLPGLITILGSSHDCSVIPSQMAAVKGSVVQS